MGCDIHMFCETRIPGEDWKIHPLHLPKNDFEKEFCGHGLLELNLGRHYWMFGVLAGIRGGQSALYYPRGMPDTASPELKAAWDYGGGDWHTPTHLSIRELINCMKEYRRQYYKKKFKIKKTFRSPFIKIRDTSKKKDWSEYHYATCVSYEDLIAWAVNYEKKNTFKCLEDLIDIKPEIRFVFWFDS